MSRRRVTDTTAQGKLDTLETSVDALATLLAGGLPAALAAGGGIKVEGVAGGIAQPVSDTTAQGKLDTLNTSVGAVEDELEPVAVAAADVHGPAANTAAVVTYALDATKGHVITGIAWSYAGGIPTGGNLKVENGLGSTVFSMDIDESGPGVIAFPRGKKGSINTAMVVTLSAGGAGVTGKVSILNHWTE